MVDDTCGFCENETDDTEEDGWDEVEEQMGQEEMEGVRCGSLGIDGGLHGDEGAGEAEMLMRGGDGTKEASEMKLGLRR